MYFHKSVRVKKHLQKEFEPEYSLCQSFVDANFFSINKVFSSIQGKNNQCAFQ